MKYKYDKYEKGVVGECENQAFLETWLKRKVAQEQKEFNDLTREEAKQKVRSLTFIQLGLKGKVVIENFPDLTQLNLSNNELEEVIIRNCPDLKLVQVAHNQLTKLKIEGCLSIKEIYTHNNQLTKWDVPIEDLKNQNLRTISYSDNPLADEEKARLDALDLKDNVLKSRVNGPAQEWLDAKYPEDIRDSIEKLDISGLGLQGDLNLKGFTNLKSLDCSDNELTDLNLNDCEELEYLDCSNNHHLNEEGFEGIIFLSLSKNKRIKEVIANNSGLEEIDANNLTKLSVLSVVQNRLTDLNLTGLVNLFYLNCGLNELTKLDLKDNTKLENLLCYENCLSQLEVRRLDKLEYLYCYKNVLEELDVGGLKNLKELYCANNVEKYDGLGEDDIISLKELNVKNCDKLEVLDCAENFLKELDISNLPNLNFFSTKENMLKSFSANNCPKLNYLDISHNFNYSLAKLIPIRQINLNGTNNIKEIYFDTPLPDGSFTGKQATIDWKNMPNLEKAEHGKWVLVEEEEEGKKKKVTCYFSEEIDVLAYRNTEKIKEFLARGEENITLEELLELSGRKKDLQGIPNELRNQLYELGQKKLKEWLSIKKNHEKRKSEEIPTPPAEEESTELPPPSPPKRRKSEPEEPEKQNKDQIIIDLHEENEKLKSRIRELENSSKTQDSKQVEKIKKEIEKTKEEINKSNLDENKKKELLKLLEELAKKNRNINNNSVDTSSSSHNYNLVWIPVLIGQAILLCALIYGYWSSWKKRKYK